MICHHCGQSLPDGSRFCRYCGEKVEIKQGKKRRAGVFVAAGLTLLLVAVLIAGAVTNWFGLAGPAVQIAGAVIRTVKAQSFTVDFDCAYHGQEDPVAGTAYVCFGPDERELTLLAELTRENKALTVGVYDEYFLIETADRCSGYDISPILDRLFIPDRQDEDAFWEEWLEGIAEGAYDQAKKYIDFDKLDRALLSYALKLNDESWLAENAGYRTEKKDGARLHCFEIDLYRFLTASLAQMKDVFLEERLYEKVCDSIKLIKPVSDRTDIQLIFGIKGGKLVHLEGAFSGHYGILFQGGSADIEADLYGIGKTELDTDRLKTMLKKAKQ